MRARIGADDLFAFASARPDLLQEASGIEPEPSGTHVRLDLHTGIRSTQRLGLGDVGGGTVVAIWPAELKSQAEYLYKDGRGAAMIAAARDRGWDVSPSPQLAFYTSPPSRRLYMKPDIPVEEYARAWEGTDGRWIGRHPPEEVRPTIWPWLKSRSYASDADDDVLEEFLAILGRRPCDLRPGLRFHRRWNGHEDQKLAAAVRDEVNAIFRAVGEPALPTP